MLGGYHSLAVEEGGDVPDGSVRLVFVSHLVTAAKAQKGMEGSTASKPSSSAPKDAWYMEGLLRMHQFYSRVLLHLAVRRLEAQAKAVVGTAAAQRQLTK
ncbi:hypothetical protein HK405_006421 [Cladochytrium tenue]|nr:hypothetical protein HK405_006421 [Cladochytrium tenue]